MGAEIGEREGEKMAAGEVEAKAEEASHSSMHERGNEYQSAGKKEGMGMEMGRSKNTISKK